MKEEDATATPSVEELDQAIRDAEQALAALKAEQRSLPAAFKAAVVDHEDAEEALAVRRRRDELGVRVLVAEIRLLRAKLPRWELELERLRADRDEKTSAAASTKAEFDRVQRQGGTRVDRAVAKARDADAQMLANKVGSTMVQLTNARGQMVTQLERLEASVAL